MTCQRYDLASAYTASATIHRAGLLDRQDQDVKLPYVHGLDEDDLLEDIDIAAAAYRGPRVPRASDVLGPEVHCGAIVDVVRVGLVRGVDFAEADVEPDVVVLQCEAAVGESRFEALWEHAVGRHAQFLVGKVL